MGRLFDHFPRQTKKFHGGYPWFLCLYSTSTTTIVWVDFCLHTYHTMGGCLKFVLLKQICILVYANDSCGTFLYCFFRIAGSQVRQERWLSHSFTNNKYASVTTHHKTLFLSNPRTLSSCAVLVLSLVNHMTRAWHLSLNISRLGRGLHMRQT